MGPNCMNQQPLLISLTTEHVTTEYTLSCDTDIFNTGNQGQSYQPAKHHGKTLSMYLLTCFFTLYPTFFLCISQFTGDRVHNNIVFKFH